MLFEREGASPLSAPTAKRLASELRKLRSYGKSSFASLTRSDGSYVQTAGGGAGCLLEWRDTERNTHLRAFVERPTVPFEDGTELVFGGGRIPLRRDEWLNISLVTSAFVAFLGGEPFPPSISWRDISQMMGLRSSRSS